MRVAIYAYESKRPDKTMEMVAVPRIGETIKPSSIGPIFPILNVLHTPGEHVVAHLYLGHHYKPNPTRAGVEDGETVDRAAQEARDLQSADAQDRGWPEPRQTGE